MKKLDLTPYELTFISGLILYTVGQYLIFVHLGSLEAIHSQSPIDFAHWAMLIGALMLIPQITHFPKSTARHFGVPILIAGIGLIVGMCTLDFVFWAINSPDLKSEVATALINTPSLWGPFIEHAGKPFNLGMLLLCATCLRETKLGPIIVLIGTTIVYLGGGWLNVVGYSILTIGFVVCFQFTNKQITQD